MAVYTIYSNNAKHSFNEFTSKLKTAVTSAKNSLAEPVARAGWHIAHTNLNKSRWSGKLQDALTIPKVSKQGTQARMMIRPSQSNVAIYNEFGVRKHYASFDKNPRLRKWAEDKGFGAKKGLLIGGAKSHIKAGKSKNAFWLKTVYQLNKQVPSIVGKRIHREFKKVA
jgi:hypothetical protein